MVESVCLFVSKFALVHIVRDIRDSNVDRTGMCFDNQYMFSCKHHSQSVGLVGSKVLASPYQEDLKSANFFYL